MGLRSALKSTLSVFTLGITGDIEAQKIAEEQGEEAKKAAGIKQAISGLRAQRERSEVIRRTRIARGQVEAQGAVTGTQQSSQVTGGVAGLESRAEGAIAFSNTQTAAGRQLFDIGLKNIGLEKEKGRAQLVSNVTRTLFGIGVKAASGGV